jgi:hypothetical protein
LAPGRLLEPQFGQAAASGEPQLSQNLVPGSLCVPQLEQII